MQYIRGHPVERSFIHTHLGLPVLILGALQNVVDYPAPGGVGEEGVSVADAEAEERMRSDMFFQKAPITAEQLLQNTKKNLEE